VRTFVIADAHGYPELIQNALDHGAFRQGTDRLVYAGDLVDRGTDAEGCIELVERYATEILMGNHDVAVMLDLSIFPRDVRNMRFQPLFLEKVLGTTPQASWKLACCVEGVLITHAGVSNDYAAEFEGRFHSDIQLFAQSLNERFLEEIARETMARTHEWGEDGVLGVSGPLWYRPHVFKPPLACTQVAGHTPVLEGMQQLGLYMIDPDTSYGLGDSYRFRYAVIEEGEVRVEEGTLA
jgi:hypothetical protein